MNLNLFFSSFFDSQSRERKDIHSTIYTSHVLYHVGLTPLIGSRRDTVVYRLCYFFLYQGILYMYRTFPAAFAWHQIFFLVADTIS